METTNKYINIIDLSLLNKENGKKKLIKQLNESCNKYGFFYIKNHGIEEKEIENVLELVKKFFELPMEIKMKWNRGLFLILGYFSIGDHYLDNEKDYKEGIYFDIETKELKDKYKGLSIYPTPEEEIEYGLVGLKTSVESYIRKMIDLSDILMGLIAESLNLPNNYFKIKDYTNDPFIFQSILRYPTYPKNFNEYDSNGNLKKFGTNPHSDFGFLSILYQDEVGGLQCKVKDEWIDAVSIKGTFVCNLANHMERLTGGYYIAALHRVLLNKTGKDRYSVPFFLGPSLNSNIQLIEGFKKPSLEEIGNYNTEERIRVHNYIGTYNDYINNKNNTLSNKIEK